MKFTAADIERIDWHKNDGLVPAIVQHAGSGSVLMLGYMNRDAAGRHARARPRGVLQPLAGGGCGRRARPPAISCSCSSCARDCDADTLLVIALPAGPVCHTGTATCFGDEPLTAAAPLSFLLELEQVIAQRIAESPEGSYTARLYAQRRAARGAEGRRGRPGSRTGGRR